MPAPIPATGRVRVHARSLAPNVPKVKVSDVKKAIAVAAAAPAAPAVEDGGSK